MGRQRRWQPSQPLREAARLKDLHRGERDNLREEQADVFERERGKLKRLEELARFLGDHGVCSSAASPASGQRWFFTFL